MTLVTPATMAAVAPTPIEIQPRSRAARRERRSRASSSLLDAVVAAPPDAGAGSAVGDAAGADGAGVAGCAADAGVACATMGCGAGPDAHPAAARSATPTASPWIARL